MTMTKGWSVALTLAIVLSAELGVAQDRGVLAIGDETGRHAFSFRGEADAVNMCGFTDCEVVATFDACLGVAYSGPTFERAEDLRTVGQGPSVWSWAETVEEGDARIAALSECQSAGGTACEVLNVYCVDVSAVEIDLGLDRTLRRLVQQRLGEIGFDAGGADGLFGPRTRVAIRLWQAAGNVPATGYLTAAQFQTLRSGGSSPGSPDGLFGPRTRGAIRRRWQEARGEPATGYLDAVQARLLRAAGAPRQSLPVETAPPAPQTAELPAAAPAQVVTDVPRQPESGTAMRPAPQTSEPSTAPEQTADLSANPNPGREQNTRPAQATGNAQLSPAILLDSYLLRAEQSVRDRDQRGAQEAMEQLVALHEEHELVLVAEYHYRYARVWNAVRAWDQALASVMRYLELTGRQGENYVDALRVMNEATAAIEEVERARERREAEDARRRAAAERARAESERQLNAARAVLAQMDFVRIPAGQFRMNPSEVLRRGYPREHPANYYERRDVRITRAFDMGRYEVTQSEWIEVMGGDRRCARCPIAFVDWDEVQTFISILNTASGGPGRIRLPTEAEWEYAARAGENRERFVRNVAESAWFDDNSGGRSHPVGLKRPNSFGLYDMIGNVREWTGDWWGYFPGRTTVEDPRGPARPFNTGFGAAVKYVIRGCGYSSSHESCEAQLRIHEWRPSLGVGFRLVRAER